MARIRTVKPGLWTHEDLSALPLETHVLAAALLNYADDEGYFNANPKLVLAACFPLRELSRSVPVMLQELVSVGYLRLFKGTDAKNYGHICKFAQHQVVSHPKESLVKVLEDSSKPPVVVHTNSVLNGIELNGIELKGGGNGNGSTQPKVAPKKPSAIPEGFVLSPEMRQYALDQGVREPLAEFEHFLNNHRAKGSKFVDWKSAWQYWTRNAAKFTGRNLDFQSPKKLNPELYQDQ